MRSIPVAGALGLTAVSFLSFFIIGQHHPFGSEASSSRSTTLSNTTAVSQSVPTADCASSGRSEPGSTCVAATATPPSEAELRASLSAFADNLKLDVSHIADALRAVSGTAANAMPAPVTAAQSLDTPAAGSPETTLDEAIGQTVASAMGRADDAIDSALPGTFAAPELAPAGPSVEVAPPGGEPAEVLRAAVQAQAQSTVDQAFAAANVQLAAPIAPMLAPSGQRSGDAPSQTTTTAPSSTRVQADPGCVVEEAQGDNWSRSAVQCFRQEVRTTGASSSSVTTASSSVSVSTTTGGAGVP